MEPILVKFYLYGKEYFPNYRRYIYAMYTKNIKQVLGENLRSAMARKYGEDAVKTSQSKLSRDTSGNVSQKTISNILSANSKSGVLLEEVPAASIEVLAQLAATLNMQPWELIHPDAARARREHEMYRKIEKDFKQLPSISLKRKSSDKEGNGN